MDGHDFKTYKNRPKEVLKDDLLYLISQQLFFVTIKHLKLSYRVTQYRTLEHNLSDRKKIKIG